MTRISTRHRARTIALATLLAVTSFGINAAPRPVPAPGAPANASLPFGLGPLTARAAYCATPNAAFTGRLTASSASTVAVGDITNANVYGYISNVDTAWACTLYRRYDGVAWNTTPTTGTFDWGTLINSTTVSCNWAVGTNDYVKANNTAVCPGTIATNAMQITLDHEGVYHANSVHATTGDFSFIHSDCATTPYYGAEVIKTGAGFSGTAGLPGANCDAFTLDSQGTTQTVTYDTQPPTLGFTAPTGGPTTITSAFYAVTFDAVDPAAGFDPTHTWSLQRQKGTWNGTGCIAFSNDATSGSLVTGQTSATGQVSSQGLELGACYQWVLSATDRMGHAATPITSGSVHVDTTGVLGSQPQFAFETWDLGGGDSLSVSTGSGNLRLDHPIVSLPIRGGSLDLSASYNSQDSASVGMGPGWRLNVQRRLTVNADGSVTFTDDTGARHTFTSPTGSPTVTYTRPSTLYATLVRDTAANPDRFTLTYRDQSKDIFDEDLTNTGLLKQSIDRNGNTVSVAYTAGTAKISAITDPAGRSIGFTWDGSGRLTQIVDWANVAGGVVQTSGSGNRTYRFTYDGSGNLASWADPLYTSGTCPTGASHLTCLTYTGGFVTGIQKHQTVTTISGSPATLGSASPVAISTAVVYANADVTTVKDAQEAADASVGTLFSHPAPGQTAVVHQGNVGAGSPATTTTYGLVSPTDVLGRNQTIWRAHGGGSIERRTTYNGTYPIEPASVTDNYGGSPARTVSYTYVTSSLGLVLRMTEPLDATNNRTTDYTYNANNDVTQKVVALNAGSTNTVTRYCYTTSGCATTATDLVLRSVIDNYKDGTPGGTNGNAEDVTTAYQYDAYGQRTRETRSNYDATGTLLDSRAIGFTYDSNGNQTSQIANYVNGTVTSGDDITPSATTNARTDLTTSYTYDTAGNRASAADPRRAILAATGSPGTYDYVTTWTYDSLNEQLTELTPTTPGLSGLQRTSTSTYDELGNARLATDFGGLVTATEFDLTGRATQTFEDPDGAASGFPADIVSKTTYDPSGHVLSTWDQRQMDDEAHLGKSQSVYDDLGRLIAQAWAVGTSDATETDYSYDDLDRQTAVVTGVADASAQATVTTYDLGGRAIAVDDEFTCTSSTYDYRDFMLTRIEGQASGSCSGAGLRTVTNTPDGLGRLKLSLVTAGQGLNDKPVDQVFDAAGNVLTGSSYVAATTTTTTVTYTVNPLDQVVAEVRSSGTWAKTNYDAAGNPTDRCLWAASPTDPCKPSGSTFASPQPTSVTTATFDARSNRITLVDAIANSTTTYDPDHNYQIQAFFLPTGGTKEHQTLYTYDEQHRIASITQKLCAIAEHPSCSVGNTLTTTGTDAYAYDVSDNRTQVNEANGAGTVNRFYCYDAVNRLIATRSATGCSSGLLDAYTYDDSGNRKSTSSVTFTYNSSGQLASCTSGCGTVTYDSAGRTQKLNGWFYEYDAQGRMIHACLSTSCTGSITKVEFTYDAMGHRTQTKEYTTGTLTKTWDFRYQGNAIVEEKLTDGAHPSGTVVRTYVVDNEGSIVKMTIPAGETGAGTYLVTWNGHGDALALWQINTSTGALTLANSFVYTTWGAPSTTTHNGIPDLGFRFLYVGEFDVQWDNAYSMGLLYMHARHYSPALGRFLQPDADGSEANLYAYAANNPVTTADPAGTCFIICAIINAAIDTAIYLATTDQSEWSVGGVAGAAVTGAVMGFVGAGILSKISKIGAVAGKLEAVAGAVGKIRPALSNGGRALVKWVSPSSKMERLVAEANRLFPKKAIRPDEWHHIEPKYLGGPKDGPQVRIPAAYHQQITNFFRELAPYGRPALPRQEVQRIMNQVYSKYPIVGFPVR